MKRKWVRKLTTGSLAILALFTAACGSAMKDSIAVGCSVGALAGYSVTGNGMGAAGGAAAGCLGGVVVGAVLEFMGGKAEAIGKTHCVMQEVMTNGVYSQKEVCDSAMTRSGYRGDPLPPAATPPTVRYEPQQVTVRPYPADVVIPLPPPPPPPPPPVMKH